MRSHARDPSKSVTRRCSTVHKESDVLIQSFLGAQEGRIEVQGCFGRKVSIACGFTVASPKGTIALFFLDSKLISEVP